MVFTSLRRVTITLSTLMGPNSIPLSFLNCGLSGFLNLQVLSISAKGLASSTFQPAARRRQIKLGVNYRSGIIARREVQLRHTPMPKAAPPASSSLIAMVPAARENY